MTRNRIAIAFVLFILMVFAATCMAGEKAPEKVLQMGAKLSTYANDPIILDAVKAANAKGMTLDQIKELDKKWMATPGVDDFMKSLMENDCAKYLKGISDKEPSIVESFVMDNLGGNVAMTNKTSDYWQGDEPKFKESFKDGKGAIHIGDVNFDDSAQAYIVQVSVPVMDGDKAIGAITFGIDVDQVK